MYASHAFRNINSRIGTTAGYANYCNVPGATSGRTTFLLEFLAKDLDPKLWCKSDSNHTCTIKGNIRCDLLEHLKNSPNEPLEHIARTKDRLTFLDRK